MRALPVSIRKNHLNKQSSSDCENLDGKFSKPKVQPRSKRSKKLVESDGETNAMFWLFRLHHWKPSDFFELGYGERQIIYAFLQLEIEQRKKEWQIEQ